MDPEVEPEFGTPKRERASSHRVRNLRFVAPLADLGTIFDPIGFRMGFPKSTFFYKILKKVKKWRRRNDTKKTWFVYRIFIEFRIDLGLIFDVFLILYHSHMQPSKPSKTFIFPMNFSDLTLQRNMIFDDFPNLFRYQFWHLFLMSFGIDFGSKII